MKILFVLFAVIFAPSAEAAKLLCFEFALSKETHGEWEAVVIRLPKDFRRAENFQVELLSRKASGKFWMGNFSCSSLPDKELSCYTSEDRGSFKLKAKRPPIFLLEGDLDVGYESAKTQTLISPKGAISSKGRRVSCDVIPEAEEEDEEEDEE